MSLKGSATASQKLRGKINSIDVIHTDTYRIAVANGYEGTIDEWLASLKGDKGDKGEKGDPGKNAEGSVLYTAQTLTDAQKAQARANIGAAGIDVAPVKLTNVTVLASAWKTDADTGDLHSQVVTIDGITEYSKVDLLPSVEQLAIFHNKDVTFVTENEDGVVTVYAIGEKPVLDYTMQAQITEVSV